MELLKHKAFNRKSCCIRTAFRTFTHFQPQCRTITSFNWAIIGSDNDSPVRNISLLNNHTQRNGLKRKIVNHSLTKLYFRLSAVICCHCARGRWNNWIYSRHTCANYESISRYFRMTVVMRPFSLNAMPRHWWIEQVMHKHVPSNL